MRTFLLWVLFSTASIYPNKLKNRNFSDEEHLRFDSEKTALLLEIGGVFSESKMRCSSKEETDSSVCLGIHSQEKPCIAVSVPAYTEIVQELSGDLARVCCLVPAGVSFHTYDPRPQDIEGIYQCSLWFSIMDPFEDKIANALLSHHASIKRIDLRAHLPLITHSCCNASVDPHIWINPHLMKIQLFTIASALKELFPEHKTEIEKRLTILLEKMDELITEVDGLLLPCKGRFIVVAHGAYGYLCHEYGIEQLSLEQEGKEPSLASFSSLIKKAQGTT